VGTKYQAFLSAFLGRALNVEDDSVKRAMEEFSNQLQEIMKSGSEYGAAVDDFNELQQRAYRLASALRSSLSSSWAVKLADFSERPVAS
jgi:hypothetical protein